MVPKVAKWLKNMIWDIGSMAGHHVSAPLPRFHNRTHPIVEPAHLWTLGWLVNGAKVAKWLQNMIWAIGSMAGHHVSAPLSRFHNRTPPVVEPAHLWTLGWLVNGAKVAKWLKNMIWDIGSMAGHHVSAPLPRFHNRTHTSPLVDPWLTCKWCQKLPNDYSNMIWAPLVQCPDTMCPHHCPGSTTGPIPLWNRPTCGPLADL